MVCIYEDKKDIPQKKWKSHTEANINRFPSEQVGKITSK